MTKRTISWAVNTLHPTGREIALFEDIQQIVVFPGDDHRVGSFLGVAFRARLRGRDA